MSHPSIPRPERSPSIPTSAPPLALAASFALALHLADRIGPASPAPLPAPLQAALLLEPLLLLLRTDDASSAPEPPPALLATICSQVPACIQRSLDVAPNAAAQAQALLDYLLQNDFEPPVGPAIALAALIGVAEDALFRFSYLDHDADAFWNLALQTLSFTSRSGVGVTLAEESLSGAALVLTTLLRFTSRLLRSATTAVGPMQEEGPLDGIDVPVALGLLKTTFGKHGAIAAVAAFRMQVDPGDDGENPNCKLSLHFLGRLTRWTFSSPLSLSASY